MLETKRTATQESRQMSFPFPFDINIHEEKSFELMLSPPECKLCLMEIFMMNAVASVCELFSLSQKEARPHNAPNFAFLIVSIHGIRCDAMEQGAKA